MIARTLKHFKKGRFGRNVATMLAGNATAQAIAVLSAPVITRLYSPENFGVMTLIWSYISMFSVVSCLRLDQTIVLEKDSKNAANLFFISILVAALLSVSLGILIWFFQSSAANLINLKENCNYLMVIPFGVLIFGFFNALTHWHTRYKNFFILSLFRVFGALAAAAIKITAPFFMVVSGAWLLAGNVIALLIPVILLGFIFCQKYKGLLHETNIARMHQVIKKYRDFPTFHSATGLLNSASQNIPVMLLAYYYSPAIVGYYGLANSILRKPIALVGQSMAKVFLQKAADVQGEGKRLDTHFLLATKGLALVGGLPFVILGVGGQHLFTVFFGDDWQTAGLYAQILAPWLFLLFINTPATQIIIAKQKIRFNFFYNLFNFVLRTLAIVVSGVSLLNPGTTILVFSITGVFTNIFYISYTYYLVKEQ